MLTHSRCPPPGRSKRDRAALRGTFRRLLAVVDAAGSPKAKIKLQHGDVLTVESMEGLVQLNFFRKVRKQRKEELFFFTF